MTNITSFLTKYAGQAQYYPATFEANALDDAGNFVRRFQWRIDRNTRDEFQRAVVADGLMPTRFGGIFITGGRA